MTIKSESRLLWKRMNGMQRTKMLEYSLHISKTLSAKYNFHRSELMQKCLWLKMITVWKVFQPSWTVDYNLKTLKRRFLHSTFQCSVKVELFLCPWNFFYFLTVTLSSEGWKLVKATLKKNNSFTSPLKQKKVQLSFTFFKAAKSHSIMGSKKLFYLQIKKSELWTV